MEGCRNNTPRVIPIPVDGCPVLFRKVEIPASLGDETTDPPVPGRFRNTLVVYKASEAAYLYTSDGMPTRIDGHGDAAALWEAINKEIDDREEADRDIWTEINTIEASSDVVDVVGTYAELQQYDTSKLHDKDLIKVLADETHDDAITYYRWSTSSESFTYVGAEGPYYTTAETDTLLSGKQDTLIAGSNIQIAADGKTISATDTTYTHFTGATASADGTQGLVPGPLAGDENKFLAGDGTWQTVQGGSTQTIFYMNASESGTTRHLYKASDMTGLVTMQDIIDANDEGQVIVRISTSVTPSMYSDMYLQNAYVASGDYQMIFLDNQYYYSFDATQTSANTFQFAKSEVQRKLTAGTNIQINGNTISATDTTYSNFTGATALAGGAAGLVPAPAAGDEDKYLKGDGTWGTVSNGATVTEFYLNSYPGNATHVYKDSVMQTLATASDINNALDDGPVRLVDGSHEYDVVWYDKYGGMASNGYWGIDNGTEVYYMSFVDSTTLFWDSFVLQEMLTAGSNITITGATISATDTTYSVFGGATSSVAGSAGLVPAPTTSDPNKFLKGDGTWSALPTANNISSTDWNGLWQ